MKLKAGLGFCVCFNQAWLPKHLFALRQKEQTKSEFWGQVIFLSYEILEKQQQIKDVVDCVSQIGLSVITSLIKFAFPKAMKNHLRGGGT